MQPPYSISDLQRNELAESGHILLREICTPNEIALHRRSIVDAVTRLSSETRPIEDRDTYGKAFLQITNLWTKDEGAKRFVFDKRFAQIAADLLGVERVRLYHDQALFKEPGGGKTPWHFDKYYWPLDTDKTVTMWMPLVDVDPDMGLMRFATGSHREDRTESVGISDESDALFDSYIGERVMPVNGPSDMRAGDATFHLGGTVHHAEANRSTKMREVMTIIYFADGARVTTPTNANQQADLDAFLPGRVPGDLADTDMNPVMN